MLNINDAKLTSMLCIILIIFAWLLLRLPPDERHWRYGVGQLHMRALDKHPINIR